MGVCIFAWLPSKHFVQIQPFGQDSVGSAHYATASKFNGSHFGLPPSSFHGMTGPSDNFIWKLLTMDWRMSSKFPEKRSRFRGAKSFASPLQLVRTDWQTCSFSKWVLCLQALKRARRPKYACHPPWPIVSFPWPGMSQLECLHTSKAQWDPMKVSISWTSASSEHDRKGKDRYFSSSTSPASAEKSMLWKTRPWKRNPVEKVGSVGWHCGSAHDWCSRGNRKLPLLAVFHMLGHCPGQRSCVSFAYFTLPPGWACEACTCFRSKISRISRDIWEISCELWDNRFTPKVLKEAWHCQSVLRASFLSCSSSREVQAKWLVGADTHGHLCSTGAKSLANPQFVRTCYSNLRWRWNRDERRTEPKIKRCRPTRVRMLMHKCISHVRPLSE